MLNEVSIEKVVHLGGGLDGEKKRCGALKETVSPYAAVALLTQCPALPRPPNSQDLAGSGVERARSSAHAILGAFNSPPLLSPADFADLAITNTFTRSDKLQNASHLT